MFRDLEARQTVLSELAGHYETFANLAYRNRTDAARAALVSGAYFGALRVRPALGRLLGPEDNAQVGESAVAVLSYDYWQSTTGGDSGVIGQDDRRERRDAHNRRRRSEWFFRQRRRMDAERIRATHDALAHGVERAAQRREPLGLLGLPVRTPQARHLDRAGACVAEHASLRNPERGRSATERSTRARGAREVPHAPSSPSSRARTARACCGGSAARRSRCCSASRRPCSRSSASTLRT